MIEINDNDTNSIEIRLKQIQDDARVYISYEKILVFYQFSSDPSDFCEDTTKYKRIITYDELLSLDTTINLIKSSNKIFYEETEKEVLEMYNNFQECFKKAQELQEKIQILHNFGKSFVYEDHLFFELNKKDKNISVSIDTLISVYRANLDVYFSQNLNQPEYPPFLKLNHLLYFGSLLQKKNKTKIMDILKKMFFMAKCEILESSYYEATKEEFIIDPIKSSIKMFSIIYEKISPYIKYSDKKLNQMNHEYFGNHFVKLQEVLFSYFDKQNFLVIKVDKPVETFHVLKMISLLLYNKNRNQYFFENFFCYEDSDISSYFLDFENEKYHLQPQYSFIIHPEFLSSQNQNVLKEKISSRMTPDPDMSLQKFVIITSSFEFVAGKKPEPLNGQVFTCGETSMLVDSNPMRDYITEDGRDFYFSIQIRQSLKAGNGKSTFINNEIKDFTEGNEYKFQVFHHFIDDGNQRIPIESFNNQNNNCKNIIHFQFNDDIMQRGIKFWSYLFQLFVDGFVLPDNGEPMAIGCQNNLVIFEIPQLRKESQPFQSLSEFPIPISSKFSMDKFSIFSNFPLPSDKLPDPISIYKTIVNPEFKNGNDITQYYLYGIKYVVDRLIEKPQKLINNLKEYIEFIQKPIFGINKNSPLIGISLRKYGYIEKYLKEFTNQYTDSIMNIEKEIDKNHFTAFFYLLTITSFYEYDCLPKEKNNSIEQKSFSSNGLTFLTVNDLFCDSIQRNQKKIHFYTTKSRDELFKPLKNFKFDIQDKYFTIHFNYIGEDPLSKNVLKNIFCSSKDYEKNVELFKDENPQSYISRTQITMPVLYRLSVILNRIFLSQPIILSGDTGCGKTSLVMLLFEYFKLPINNEMYSLNVNVCDTLNCNGEITVENVINHLKKTPKRAKNNVVFFDKLNESPASSYIEHLFLRENDINHCNFVFIGALNPIKRKNPISSKMTKIGFNRCIKAEEKKINLMEDISMNQKHIFDDDISDMMYQVNHLHEASQDIIFDFNPFCFEDKFYPEEEKNIMHLIIENGIKYPLNEIKRNSILSKLEHYIDICILFIRRLMNERAVISYRDIERTMTIYNTIFEYYEKSTKEVKDTDIPMITAIISFVLRLPNNQKFDVEDLIEKDENGDIKIYEDGSINDKCVPIFIKVFKKYFGDSGDNFGKFKKVEIEKDKINDERVIIFRKVLKEFYNKYFSELGDFEPSEKVVYEINIRDKLLSLLSRNEQKFSKNDTDIDKVKKIMKTFMTLVYQYTLKYIQKDSIWKFQSTFIHIFIMDICIKSKIPCFIIGMPGTSKSYAFQILKNHYGSKLISSTYLASKMTSVDGIKSHYYDVSFKEITNNMIDKNNDNYVVFIDKIGNTSISKSHPLGFLHEILDHGLALNETGYRHKVTTIGVSNYSMDFASMNRGLLVYTELPDLTENLTVFAINSDKYKTLHTNNATEFIDYRENINKDKISQTFNFLWPERIPKTIALRSIYSMQDLLSRDGFDIHLVCRILRELFNSKRLNEIKDGEPYKNLHQECPQNAIEKLKYDKLDNLACFIERIACDDTASNKSLSLFTKNYEAIEYFELFKDDIFIKFLQNQFKVNDASAFLVEKGKFKKFKYQLFAEDFKKSPDQISQDALTKIIECISKKYKGENVLFIGNHPCFDSCLDLLNVPHKKDHLEREVTLGSVFSSNFLLTNTDFYIMIIANIKDLENNLISSEFLDRTEIIYLDWEIIGPYYLRFKFEDLIKQKFSVAEKESKEIAKILNEQSKYETTEPFYLHSCIQILYDRRRRINLNHYYTTELLEDRFSKGIKSVILTKSKILEEIYLPTEIDRESILIVNDTNIEDFDNLRKSIDSLVHNEDNNKGEKLIIINCSKFDELHFAHLKTFFDEISDLSKSDIKYHIFIIYYGCDPKDFDGLSTFRWPIFAMEDISIHPELESKSKRNAKTKEIEKVTNQLTYDKIQHMILKLNHMDEDVDGRLCHHFFSNLFDKIIQNIENDIREKSRRNDLCIKTNYDKSEFKKHADFYEEVKQKFDADSNFNYFDIQIDSKSNISSTKSQMITQVYHKLCDVMQPFFLFRFGSSIIQKKINLSDFEDFLLKCRYLDLSLNSFLSNPEHDLYVYLFLDFFEFLITNQASFDENMRKRKLIADRAICAIGIPEEVEEMFEEAFYVKSYNEKFNSTSIKFILDSKYEFDNNYNSELIFLQYYVDFYHLRTIAGLNIAIHQTLNYWDKYINFCLFSKDYRDDPRGTDESKNLTRTKMIESIAEFRNKSIFDIFISPIESEDGTFESNICKKLISSDDYKIDLELNDSDYQIYKEMNENPDSLKSENRLNKLKGVDVTYKNKFTILSILVLNAESKWDGNVQREIVSKFEGINNFELADLDSQLIKTDKIKNLNLDQDKFIPFRKIWTYQYQDLDWYFKGDCLIDSIQTFLNKNSLDEENTKFRKWFLYGFDTDEPLSIIAFRRFLSSQTEYKDDLVNILDPFFGDPRILALFNDYIGDRIPEEDSFPMPRITDDYDEVMKRFSFRNTFRFPTTTANRLYRFTSKKPYLSQFVWFHVAFNKPSDYPLITLLIKESIFFTDFRVVPKIINSIVHLRHIFSYNPVFIPIILHCTSLFEGCDCKLLLHSLGYFDTPNNHFNNIKNELNSFKEFLKLNYKDSYEILQKKSSYEQIKFILSMYYSKYNKIIEQINDYSNKASKTSNKLSIINACDVLPNMLMTNFTLNDVLLPILYIHDFTRFIDFEYEISKLFATSECFNSFTNYVDVKTTFPLFKVLLTNKIDENMRHKSEIINELKKDFLGFTPEDYISMFQNHLNIGTNIRIQKLNNENASLNYHASVLSFFLHLYLNKDDDDISKYMDVKDVNDISKTHMNTYATVINYDLVIHDKGIVLSKNQLKYEDDEIVISYEENSLYPLQRIFKLLPIELRYEIKNYQNQVGNGFNIIKSEEDLSKEEDEIIFEDENNDDDEISEDD